MEFLQLSTFIALILIALICGFYGGYEMSKEEQEKKYTILLNHYNDLRNFKEFNRL